MSEIPKRTLVKYLSLVSVGSLIDWYDIFVVGVAAALVWPSIMFPPENPAVALAGALAGYFVNYFARPVGAMIFGHFGDKIGRKTTLIWTLILTAISMAGLALMPTYAEIGILAPALIILLRFIQGMGLGGEYGGGATLLMEHFAKSRKRSFYSGIYQATTTLGQTLSISALLLATIIMGKDAFASIGWRILIGVGAAIAIIGGIIRYVLLESPLFQEIVKKRQVVRAPVLELFRKYWKRVVRLTLTWSFIPSVFGMVIFPAGLSYMIELGIPELEAYYSLIIGTLVGVIGEIVGGYLGDIIGRRYVMIIGAIVAGIAVPLYYLLLVPTKVFALVALATSLVELGIGLNYGPIAAYFSEHFPTKYRYSGVGISYTLGAFIDALYLSGFLPLAIIAAGGLVNAAPYIIIMTLSLVIVAIIALSLSKETKDVDFTSLDTE